MKNFGKLCLAVAGAMMLTLQVNAQNAAASNQTAQNAAKTTSRNFVDKDNNGICDNFGARAGNSQGRNFVDKNNDGICDNRGNAGKKSATQCRNGQGNQYRHGHGQGQGKYCRR